MNKDAILNWIKTNPLIVACLAVILLALVSFYYPSHVQAVAFREEVAARQQLIGTMNGLRQSGVEVPAANPDQPPEPLTMVVNAAAVQKLQSIYAGIQSQYATIFQEAAKRNMAGHEPMLPGLFPSPVEQSRLFDTRPAYAKILASFNQTLKAGTPPDKAAIDNVLDAQQEDFRRTQLGVQQFSPAQQVELAKRQATAIVNLLNNNASRFFIYAPPIVLSTSEWNGGAFQAAEWARPANAARPSLADVWEAQMQLWIQQDIVDAIAIANNVNNPQGSVKTSPVKRLLQVYVRPGYVGLTAGGQTPAPGNAQPTDENAAPTDAPAAPDPNQRLTADYTLSPTGRQSNHIYDVRHAGLSVIIDSQKIPQLLNAIAQVNYMTVIGTTLSDVDGYAELAQGYYYGSNVDVVKLDLVLETIWLRSWTAGVDPAPSTDPTKPAEPSIPGLMPDEVRVQLKLPPRSGAAPAAPPTSAGNPGH